MYHRFGFISYCDKPKVVITEEDLKILIKEYDKNRDGKLSDDEILDIVENCKKNSISNPEVLKVIAKFDLNNDHQIDEEELKVMRSSLNHIGDTSFRYAGYSATFARAFRYLAFTSGCKRYFNCIVSLLMFDAYDYYYKIYIRFR
jgi:hypothetical protein